MEKIVNIILCVFIFCVSFSCNRQNTKEAKVVTEESNAASAGEVEDGLAVDEPDTGELEVFHLFSDSEFDISIQECDVDEYKTSYQKYYEEEKTPVVIRSIDSILLELAEINVSLTLLQPQPEFETIGVLYLANGDSIEIDAEGIGEVGIVAYYPEYHFLLLEGGHSSEMGFNVLTGEDIFEAGNPYVESISPNNKFRLSAIYGGQECCTFVLQKIEDGVMTKLLEIDDYQILCFYTTCFWVDDYTLYYQTGYSDNYSYYKLVIDKK